MQDLTPEEHSRLVYLLDALRAVVDKSSRKVIHLLQVVYPKADASQAYLEAWDRLSTAFWDERLVPECAKLREDLR